MNVDGELMVIDMLDAINNSFGKIEGDQVEVHGRSIIEAALAQTHYQTARSYAGIAIRELFRFSSFLYVRKFHRPPISPEMRSI